MGKKHNPTHNWEEKGEWKCTYFLNEKDLVDKEVILSLENLLARKFVDSSEGPIKLISEMKRVVEKGADTGYKGAILKDAQAIVDLDWFKQTYQQSPQLSEFYEYYRSIKGNPTSNPQPTAPQ